MTRICMLVTSELDRDPRVQKEARIAAEAGYEVTVICRTYDGPQLPYKVIQTATGRRNSTLGKITERLLTNVRLARSAVKEAADIIHANDLDTVPAGLLAARLTGAQLVYDAHELWSEMITRGGWIGRKAAVLAERFLSHRADAVVTVSKFRAKCMVDMLGIAYPTVVMNTPYYVEPEQLNVTDGSWTEQFAGKRIVLYQGRYTHGMGLADAVHAAKLLPEDVVVVFRGFGPAETEIQDAIVQDGLAGKVVLIPPVPMKEIVTAAVGADIGLILYRPVNLNNLYAAPNKIFEYMTAGVPCVASDLPFLREVIYDNEIGVVFRPGDSEEMARAITGLLDSPAQLQRMKQNCLQRAPLYSWQVEGAKLLDVYRKLLNTKSRSD